MTPAQSPLPIRFPDRFLRFSPWHPAPACGTLASGSIPAMPALLLMPDAVAIPSDESPVKREANLKGRLPDSHEIATETVPVPELSPETRWRGRLLAD